MFNASNTSNAVVLSIAKREISAHKSHNRYRSASSSTRAYLSNRGSRHHQSGRTSASFALRKTNSKIYTFGDTYTEAFENTHIRRYTHSKIHTLAILLKQGGVCARIAAMVTRSHKQQHPLSHVDRCRFAAPPFCFPRVESAAEWRKRCRTSVGYKSSPGTTFPLPSLMGVPRMHV